MTGAGYTTAGYLIHARFIFYEQKWPEYGESEDFMPFISVYPTKDV